jgi:hypothetical protein
VSCLSWTIIFSGILRKMTAAKFVSFGRRASAELNFRFFASRASVWWPHAVPLRQHFRAQLYLCY